MIYFTEAALSSLSIHRAGNKMLDEKYTLSDAPYEIQDDVLEKLLLQYFLGQFEKTNEIYRFYHPNNDLDLNETYHFIKEIFENPTSFHDNSIQLTKHLYEMSNHPRIKSGELYITLFEKLQVEGELHRAVGIFKSETKETYLRVAAKKQGFSLDYEQDAINIRKLDKGCVVFDTEKEEGYKVAVIDQSNKNNDTQYWVDEFLQLKVRNDNYNQTNNTLTIYKDFIKDKLEESFDLTKTDKIDLLNRSMKYFKEKDEFNLDEFAFEVINNEQGIAAFKHYKNEYEEESGNVIADNFSIHNAAVKKQARVYKSVLKLDKNFHIYIHGNNELIEKGFDEAMNMNYYKVYFREEA